MIELLMVITIIGFFASIILVSLNQARIRGNDAGVKSNLSAMRSVADLFYDSNGNSYGTFASATCPSVVTGTSLFSNQGIINSINAAVSAGDGTSRCIAGGNTYAVAVGLRTSGQSWCIDSQGKSKQFSGTPTSAISVGGICN